MHSHLHITISVLHFTDMQVITAFAISVIIQALLCAFVMDGQRSGVDGTCEDTLASEGQLTIAQLNGYTTVAGPALVLVLLLSGGIMLASLLGVETAAGSSTKVTTEAGLQLLQQALEE